MHDSAPFGHMLNSPPDPFHPPFEVFNLFTSPDLTGKSNRYFEVASLGTQTSHMAFVTCGCFVTALDNLFTLTSKPRKQNAQKSA